jgi:hypothetical protein
MSAWRRTTAAVAAVVVVILLAGCAPGDGTTTDQPPPARPSATGGSACPPVRGTCRGDLAAGTYTSATFRRTITYTVPQGWTNRIDLPRAFELARIADPVENFYGSNAIDVMLDVGAAAQNCDESLEPGVGRSADQLARWVAGLPGVQASQPRPVTVGGWSGSVVDVSFVATWTKTCPFADEPVVPLALTGDPAQFHPARTFIARGISQRLFFLDAPNGGNVLITVLDIPEGIGLADYVAIATPIIDSIRFAS